LIVFACGVSQGIGKRGSEIALSGPGCGLITDRALNGA